MFATKIVSKNGNWSCGVGFDAGGLLFIGYVGADFLMFEPRNLCGLDLVSHIGKHGVTVRGENNRFDELSGLQILGESGTESEIAESAGVRPENGRRIQLLVDSAYWSLLIAN